MEITGGENFLLTIDEIMSVKFYSKMMIDDHQLSWVYHVIYMIIVLW